MKRYFYVVAAVVLWTGLVEASPKGKGNGNGNGGGNGAGQSSKVVSNSVKKVNGQGIGQSIGKGSGNGQSQILSGKLNKIQGNQNVAKLPGFKSNHAKHTQFCGKFGVPHSLHSHCFFHHDFCYNHHCWLPSHGCCGYWHPYSCSWYYWYEPWSCYLPYSSITTYRPVAVVAVTETPVIVNVTNTNTNTVTNIEPADPMDLPPGALASLPAGVNPMIPAPKQ